MDQFTKGETMKNVALISIALTFLCGNAAAAQLTYLSCDLPAQGDNAASHFDFTLDEQNSTVSFYVKEANATNTEKAVFGPETITWATNNKYFSLTRTISRVDLSFVQDMDVAGLKSQQVGTCKLNAPKARKF